MDLDTETLVALVSSVLDHTSDQETILEALVRSEGDVQRAANVLNKSHGFGEKGKKRKGQTLDDWFKKLKSSASTAKHVNQKASLNEGVPTLIDSINPRSTVRSQATMDSKTVLRPPLSENNLKRRIKSLPPLTLSNPSMVAEHTPCTLHLSILPPELACQLFYTLLEASKKWQRNKWWLFDRIVESSHRTSFYARLEGDGLVDQRGSTEWQEAARFWCVCLYLTAIHSIGLYRVNVNGLDFISCPSTLGIMGV